MYTCIIINKQPKNICNFIWGGGGGMWGVFFFLGGGYIFCILLRTAKNHFDLAELISTLCFIHKLYSIST